MNKVKTRFVISIMVCLSMLISQTVFSLAYENDTNQNFENNSNQEKLSEPDELTDPLEIYESANPNGSVDLSGTEEEIIDDLTVDPVKGSDYNGYIVCIKKSETDEVIESAKDDTVLKEINENILVVENPEDAAKFVSASAIIGIEPNYQLTSYAFPQSSPNDPYYKHADNYQWGIKKINAAATWKLDLRGNGVTVAIFDTGLNHLHQDMKGNNIVKYNYISSPAGITMNDQNGHGSFVTSVIAAKSNNKVGIAGITDQVKIISVKVLDAKGAGDVGDLYDGLYRLIQTGRKIDVVNLSLGHPGNPSTWDLEKAYVKYLTDRGTIVISATGNQGDPAYLKPGEVQNQVNLPAALDNVISVGSIGKNGAVSSFSNKNAYIDVTAPGESIVGISYADNTKYLSGSGTSYAAPMVASAAIIAKQINPKINYVGFRNALKASSVDAGAKGWDSSYGYGVLNLSKLSTHLLKNAKWKKINGNKYYFNANGTRATKWKKIGKSKYYFGTDGKMQTKWKKIGKSKYYFGTNGKMQTKWKKIGKSKYYFGTNGKMQTKWKKIGKKKYYFGKNGKMVTGTKKIGKKKYKFNKKGVLIKKL